MDKRYAIIFAIMVTEVLGFSLILPFLPFFAESHGASPLVYGLILTTFSIFQFISAPVMGRLSDHYGRKPMLIFSQMSTFLSFVILGFANNIWMILISRIVDGMLGSNMTIAQAYISDISTKKDRSKAFGIAGVAFGIGFLIGPGIGGYLAKIDYSIPCFIAAGVSLITIILTYTMLPETIKRKKDFKFNIKKAFHLGDFKKYFHNKKTSSKLFQYFSYALTHAIYVTSFAFFAERMFGFGSDNIGLLLTYVGVISIIMRGFLLGKMIDYFGEHKLRYYGIISVFIGMILLSILNTFPLFLIAMTLFSLGAGLAMPLLSGEISRQVGKKEQGSLSGVRNSLQSIAQIFGPVIGNSMINFFYPGSLGIAAGIVIFSGLYLMVREDLSNSKSLLSRLW